LQKELPTVYAMEKDLRPKDFFLFRHRESFGEAFTGGSRDSGSVRRSR